MPSFCSRHSVKRCASLSWCRHQMETFSALLALCAGNSPVTGEFPAQRSVTQSFDVFLMYAWINCWVNNREADDLRRYRAQYDVTVMLTRQCGHCQHRRLKMHHVTQIQQRHVKLLSKVRPHDRYTVMSIWYWCAFTALMTLCAGNVPVTGKFPA